MIIDSDGWLLRIIMTTIDYIIDSNNNCAWMVIGGIRW